MSTPTAKQVMDLRNATGLPMMKCKEALEAEGCDFEKAHDRLRKEGLKTAESKASRATSDGLVRARVANDGLSGTIVAVLCETEPVSKTPMFREFVDRLLDQVEKESPKDVAALLAKPWIGDKSSHGAQTVDQALKSLVAKIGENMKIDKAQRLVVQGSGVVATYVHHDNKHAALVAVAAEKVTPELKETARQLAMHVVFARPVAGTRQEVAADAIERERGIYKAQMAEDPKMKGKPAQVLEKIIEGKVDAFFKEKVLVEQPWFREATKNVTQVLKEAGGTVQGWILAVVGA